MTSTKVSAFCSGIEQNHFHLPTKSLQFLIQDEFVVGLRFVTYVSLSFFNF